jgi:hypothetical protein
MDTILAAAVKPEEDEKKDGEEVKKEDAPTADAEMTNGDASAAPASPNGDTDTKPSLDPSASPFVPTSTSTSSPLPYSIGSYTLTAPTILSILTVPLEVRIRAAPAAMGAAERVKIDLENVGKVVEALEARAEEDGTIEKGGEGRGSGVIQERKEAWEKELEGRKEGMDEKVVEKEAADIVRVFFILPFSTPSSPFSNADRFSIHHKQLKRTLDLSLSYLRSAFDTCYYCCVVCDSPEQLADLCPKHVRRADDGGNYNRRNNGAYSLPHRSLQPLIPSLLSSRDDLGRRFREARPAPLPPFSDRRP